MFAEGANVNLDGNVSFTAAAKAGRESNPSVRRTGFRRQKRQKLALEEGGMRRKAQMQCYSSLFGTETNEKEEKFDVFSIFNNADTDRQYL